jgi:hypothetical protein
MMEIFPKRISASCHLVEDQGIILKILNAKIYFPLFNKWDARSLGPVLGSPLLNWK